MRQSLTQPQPFPGPPRPTGMLERIVCLAAADFTLLDNGCPVKFEADGYVPPIALAVAVETGNLAAPALTRVRSLGPMIEPLITGQRGKAALIAYDHQVRLIQELTSDTNALKRGFASLKPRGGNNGRLLDGVEKALEILRDAPRDARRVVLIIGESKDRASQAKIADILTAAQRDNALVYAMNYSPMAGTWSVKNSDLPKTPCCNWLESIAELARLGKENTSQVLARETGGRVLGFLTREAMEEAVTSIGEELHSQYLLSFAASGEPGEYHSLEVQLSARVPNAAKLTVRARPGYWAAE